MSELNYQYDLLQKHKPLVLNI
uniref:Uncharacterized protein n=1 Tax=Rhizophora mucronata TaxID=61149 RepID=A0A2P2QK72_RHIMU